MEAHYATIFEKNADTVPDRPALICGEVVRTWKEYDDRAARIASMLSGYGLGPDSKVGLYLHNSNEYLEAHYASFKISGVPINVNYRYKEEELIYLLDNSDSEAVFFQGCYSDQIKSIKDQLPKVKVFIQVQDGHEQLDFAENYNEVIVNNEPMERYERSEDNIYMLYTGGTTGMPKGVMYTHGGFVRSLLGTAGAWGLVPVDQKLEIEDIHKEVLKISEEDNLTVNIPACPLMHGTGMWLGALIPHLVGGCSVTIPKLGFDPDHLFKEVERVSATNLVIVGDAFAKPMVDALDHAANEGRPYKLDTINTIVSSGVMWSSEVKQGLLRHYDFDLVDAMGSTEGGMGSSRTSRDSSPDTAKFQLNPGVIVITDDGEHVKPGSGVMGKIGTSGLVPEGYYKDEKKSAETFKEFEGKRYSFPGDYATVEEDGSITLLGRGSNCINTAGEKVYPEEVEEAIKRHEDIYDCLVVGLKDDRFGQRIVALASFVDGREIEEQDLISFTRENIAGYKLPKQVLFVDEVMRAPNGKANYKWANETAEKELV
jgi:fatty-acyl-CoA synthase